MKSRTQAIGRLYSFLTLAIAASMFFLLVTGCSARRTKVLNTQVGSCNSPLIATLEPLSGSLSGVGVGTTISWMVKASGCTGKYKLEHDSASFTFSSVQPAVFKVTYAAAREMKEFVEVQAIDDSGAFVGSAVTASSESFTVGGVTACTVIAGDTEISAAVNGSNQMTGPVSAGFQVNHTAAISLRQILDNGAVVPSSSVIISLPTALATQHNLQVSISSLGQHAFRFQVQNSAGVAGECQISVNVVASASTIQITDFRATPMVGTIGQPMALSMTVTGTVTSSSIDGIPAPLTSGSYVRPISPTRTGAITSTATVSGPGGTATRTTNFLVNPACAIRPIAPPASLPGNLSLGIDVQGDFLVAAVDVQGVTVGSIPGAPGGVTNYSVTVPMSVSPSTVAVRVFGPNGTEGNCGGTAVFNAPPVPTAALSVNGAASSATSVFEVPYLSNVALVWSSSNATACTLNPGNQSGTSGNFTVNQIAANTRYELVCTGPGGSVTVPAQVNISCPANVVTTGLFIHNQSSTSNAANLLPSSVIKPGYKLFASDISGSINPWVGGNVGSSDCRIGMPRWSDTDYIPLVRFRSSNGVISSHSLGELESDGVVIPANATRADGVYIDENYASNSGQCNFTLTQKPLCAP